MNSSCLSGEFYDLTYSGNTLVGFGFVLSWMMRSSWPEQVCSWWIFGFFPIQTRLAMSAKAISEQTGKEFLYKYICTSSAIQNRFKYARVTPATDWARLTQDHPWLLSEVRTGTAGPAFLEHLSTAPDPSQRTGCCCCSATVTPNPMKKQTLLQGSVSPPGGPIIALRLWNTGAEIAVNKLLITAQKVKEAGSDRDVSPCFQSLALWNQGVLSLCLAFMSSKNTA